MYDPDLHLFVSDDEILAFGDVVRMQQTLRRETPFRPALERAGRNGDSPIGYSAVVPDPEAGVWRAWLCFQGDDRFLTLAVSEDEGRSWTRKEPVMDNVVNEDINNLTLVPVGPDADEWFQGAKYAGYALFRQPPQFIGKTMDEDDRPVGIYGIRSEDGERLEVKYPPIIPHKGDRSCLCFDEATGGYFFISRPYYGHVPGYRPTRDADIVRHRMANLWTSRDLVNWDNRGPVVRHDELDPQDAQIYGMVPFRYGRGFLAFLEILHWTRQQLDVQLAWSNDGIHWQRVDKRDAILPLGGEGAWDSQWVVPTNNPPIASGERLLVPYVGAGTKHSTGARHRRSLGLASIRKDGFVSLESGLIEGRVVTCELPLTKPMKLEINVNAYSGHIGAEVTLPIADKLFDPIPGYDADASRVEHVDSVSHRVIWGERDVVLPVETGVCHLSFCMRQSSLFSYRWSEA